MEHEGDGGTNCDWCVRNDLQRTDNRCGRTENKKTSGDHPDSCWSWQEYWGEFWRLTKTCWHSDSSERPSTNNGVKNS